MNGLTKENRMPNLVRETRRYTVAGGAMALC